MVRVTGLFPVKNDKNDTKAGKYRFEGSAGQGVSWFIRKHGDALILSIANVRDGSISDEADIAIMERGVPHGDSDVKAQGEGWNGVVWQIRNDKKPEFALYCKGLDEVRTAKKPKKDTFWD